MEVADFGLCRYDILTNMGDITIKIPQKINRSFKIDSPESANEILLDIERRSASSRMPSPRKIDRLSALRELAKKYRENPDQETLTAIKLAEEWRKKWDR